MELAELEIIEVQEDNEQPKRSRGLFDQLDLRTVLIVLCLMFGWGVSWATISARQDDLSHRITELETNQVPRSETTARNDAFASQLNDIKIQLNSIQQQVLKILER